MMGQKAVLTVLIALMITGNISAIEWYRSSAGGHLGTPVRNSGEELEGWSISVDQENEIETRSLYFDGVLNSVSVFYRKERRLIAREEFNNQDTLLSRVEYAYDQEGNPRAVYISTEDDTASKNLVETDSLINPDGLIHRHIAGSSGQWRITDLNESGLPLSRRTLEDSKLVEESVWRRNEDGTLQEVTHISGNEERRSRYDTSGRLLDETTVRNGMVTLVRNYFWTAGNLTRMEERGEGRVLVREMQWSGDRMIFDSRSENGIVVSQTEWISTDEKVETLYRNGKAVIRVYWDGDIRQREEFLRDGKVIRTREAGV